MTVTQRGWRVVRHHVGRRGAFLLFLAEVDLFYAYALAFPTRTSAANATNQWFATMLPLDAWACLWFAVGLICLFYAFQRHDRLGYIAAIFIKVVWTGLSLIGMWFADVAVSGPAIWLSLAGAVWVISGWRESGLDAEDAEHGNES